MTLEANNIVTLCYNLKKNSIKMLQKKEKNFFNIKSNPNKNTKRSLKT